MLLAPRHVPQTCNVPGMIGGDGGVVSGGAEARHSSTAAANKLAALLYPDANNGELSLMAEWEKFHRSEAAFRACLAQSEFAQELFAVAKAMSQQFGFGVGRVLLRSVTAVTGDRDTPACDVGGTRRGEAMTRVAENIIQNYRKYAAGLHVRLARRRAGHGASTLQSLVLSARRLLSIDFVVFCLVFSDTRLGMLLCASCA